jgi:hypothetical protein
VGVSAIFLVHRHYRLRLAGNTLSPVIRRQMRLALVRAVLRLQLTDH